jgi:siroheme synthase (precorrin-2 oxidase/ferrochelatase)
VLLSRGVPGDEAGEAARRRISQFIEKLARPHVVPRDIEASYRDMAADESREQNALEWSEALIADSSLAEPHASR